MTHQGLAGATLDGATIVDRPAEDGAVKFALLEFLLREGAADHNPDATVVLAPSAATSADGTALLQSLSLMLMEGRDLAALALCHRLLRETAAAASTDIRPKLLDLRKLLERQFLSEANLTLAGPQGCIHLLPRRSVLIGRPSSAKQVDIAIDCRWLSRGDHNLCLSHEGATWVVEDLGSTNGCFIGGERLEPGRSSPLPMGETHIEIGQPDDAAPIAIQFCRPPKDPGGVAVRIRQPNPTGVVESEAWPSMPQDISSQWVVFREQVAASAAEDCAIRIADDRIGIAAAVRYQGGFWIVPAAERSIILDGIDFQMPVPLPVGARLILGNSAFEVQPSAPSSMRQDDAQ